MPSCDLNNSFKRIDERKGTSDGSPVEEGAKLT